MFSTKVCRKLWASTFGLSYAFAQLSKNAQRAIWACRIIKEIKEAKQETDFFEQVHGGKRILKPTLADKIKNLTISSFQCSEGELDDGIRKEVMTPFKDGVILDDVFRQKIMADGTHILRNEVKLAQPSIFYPSVLVTKFVFQHIMDGKQQFLLYGNYGISKTMSIILFQWLSAFTNFYFFQSHQNQEQKRELDSLYKRNLIFQVPKLLYINNREAHVEKDWVSMIIKQCKQLNLSKEQLADYTYKSSTTLFQQIYENYSKRGIKFVLMIDSMKGQYYTDSQQTLQTHDQVYQSLKKMRQDSIQRNNTDLCQILTKNILVNKPIDLDRDFIVLADDRELKFRCGKVGYTHCVWFQVQRKLIQLSKDSETIEKIKQLYYNQMAQKKYIWRNYIHFAAIEQSIFPQLTNSQNQSPFENIDENNFNDCLREIIYAINFRHFHKKFSKQVSDYYSTGSSEVKSEKTKVLLSINNFAFDREQQLKLEQEERDEDLQDIQDLKQIEFKIEITELNKRSMGRSAIKYLTETNGTNEPLSFYYETIESKKYVVIPFYCSEFKKYIYYSFQSLTSLMSKPFLKI